MSRRFFKDALALSWGIERRLTARVASYRLEAPPAPSSSRHNPVGYKVKSEHSAGMIFSEKVSALDAMSTSRPISQVLLDIRGKQNHELEHEKAAQRLLGGSFSR
jgi:hypothetical protein